MANPKIFCNVPWTNTHLYWDGTYGACCSERQKITKTNIKETSLVTWFNSDDMRNFRQRILGDTPLPECESCYYEESHGHESRRIKENFKSAVFTTQAFDASYKQTPWYKTFEHSRESGTTAQLPRDWHIDFGNECNLACKMCSPHISSKIAQQYRSWDIKFDQATNWTNDDSSWQQILENLNAIPVLHRLHIMGGEPTYNKKFYKLIDWFIDNDRTDFSFSFVTNGTNLQQSLIDKLQKFKSVDIEISIESFHAPSNNYIRQGSDTNEIIKNIKLLLPQQSDRFHIVLRSVPQLLNINTYHEYIQFAYDNNVSVQSIPLTTPSYLAINVLPWHIRQALIPNFEAVKAHIIKNNKVNFSTITTGRDVSRLGQQLIKECDSMISMLGQYVDDIEAKRTELVEWLIKWDQVYKFDARICYPEYKEFLEHYGYQI